VPGYEILGILGRGGMGVVYKARQTELNRLVALKMVLAGSHAGEQDLARFRNEAEAVARLQHPNIVQIFEIGEAEGRPFFSLEFVDGGSLASRLRGTPQPPRQAAQLVETVARAMHAAHLQGIVHRDLKPSNILLASGGRECPVHEPTGDSRPPLASYIPKISDFGLAKFLNKEESLTVTGEIVGTISYMAPEQAWGKSKVRIVSPTADVYALGAILYEMLTGRPPFQGETLQDTLEQVWSQDPVAPRRLNPKIPRDLDTICLKALHKEPHKRYATARDLADDLQRCLKGETIQARPAGTVAYAWKWAVRNPAKSLALAAALCAVLGLLLWLHSEQRRLEADLRAQRTEEVRKLEAQQRLADLRRDVSNDEVAVKAQIAAGQFDQAGATLERAIQRLRNEPALDDLRTMLVAKKERVQRLAGFARHSASAWFAAGEERYPVARAAGEAALEALGIADAAGHFRHPDWWNHLPAADLSSEQAERLQEEIYRQLILLTQLRAMPGLGKMTVANWVGLAKNPQAAADFQSAQEAVQQAHALEKAGRVPPGQTVRLFRKFLRELLHKAAGAEAVPPDREELSAGAKTHPTNPADYFFSGFVHYFIGKSTNNAVRAAIGQTWKKDLDFETPMATAELMLTEAIRRDPRQFWPYFVLGRVLYAGKQYRAAEMAFNTCIQLDPNYPVSYQHRGLAICQRALDPKQTDAAQRDKLLHLVREDFRRAEEKAPNNPVTFWAKGELYALLGQEAEALEAYARGLELEDQLQKMISRRDVLNQAAKFVDQILAKQPKQPNAWAVRALIYLHQEKYDAAAAAAGKARERRARAVLGAVLLHQGKHPGRSADKRKRLNQALEFFQDVLKEAPDYYLAAVGRALAFEELGENQKALEAFDYLLSTPQKKKSQVALTPGQQVEAHEGRYRVLGKLGRPDEAAQALREARRLDPTATGASRLH
jgi:tetratricopeptide (TPR) repeat protein/tRNA A-37 threonylcarbamoyl transferase component Bud32